MAREPTIKASEGRNTTRSFVAPALPEAAPESQRKHKLLRLLMLLLKLMQRLLRLPTADILLSATPAVLLIAAWSDRRFRSGGELLHPFDRRVHPFLGRQRLIHQIELIAGKSRDDFAAVVMLKVHHYRLFVHHVEGIVKRLPDRHRVESIHKGDVSEQLP